MSVPPGPTALTVIPRRATSLANVAVNESMLASGAIGSAVVEALGYYDEPHLAWDLRRYVGRTAGQLREGLGGALALDPAYRTTS